MVCWCEIYLLQSNCCGCVCAQGDGFRHNFHTIRLPASAPNDSVARVLPHKCVYAPTLTGTGWTHESECVCEWLRKAVFKCQSKRNQDNPSEPANNGAFNAMEICVRIIKMVRKFVTLAIWWARCGDRSTAQTSAGWLDGQLQTVRNNNLFSFFVSLEGGVAIKMLLRMWGSVVPEAFRAMVTERLEIFEEFNTLCVENLSTMRHSPL